MSTQVNVKVVNFGMSPYTVLPTDKILDVNSAGGAIVINLPALTTAGLVDEVVVMHTVGANNITINASVGQTINTGNSVVLNSIGNSMTFASVTSTRRAMIGSPRTINYNTTSMVYNRIIWTGTATTNGSGVASFFPTDTGLVGGTPLFTTIQSVQATAVNNTASVASVPIASVKTIATNQIDVNVVESATVVLASQGLEFSGAGITVHLVIFGV